jgi:preprotein translocase subunit YajC
MAKWQIIIVVWIFLWLFLYIMSRRQEKKTK